VDCAREGFDVFTATSGEVALTVFAEEKPDLTLLDIVLPGMDGVEVLRKMKQESPR
jgi:DNA-binding response OmpR family regulator